MNLRQLKLSDISIRCLLGALIRNLWMLVASALIFAMGISLYMQRGYVPQYNATMTYAVMARNIPSYSYSNQAAASELTSVMTQLVSTDLVMGEVRAHSPKLAGFGGTIAASQVNNSNMVIVTVTSDSPETSFLAIQALQEVFPTIVEYISTDCVMQVIRDPAVSPYPINYVNTSSAAKRAAVVGAGLMALLVCFLHIRRETIQTRSAARHLLDANILATVYRVRRPFSLRNFKIHAPIQVFSPTTGFAYSEQINTICTSLENEAATNGSKVFLITGVGENEGKSTIAGNVAAAMAMRGKQVAVIDCDLRNPSLGKFFGGNLMPKVPLNRLLAQKLSRDNLMQSVVRHEKLGLYMLLPAGPDKRCTELLSGPSMETLLAQLHAFDVVIVDTPPMGYFADTEVLIDNVDATMLVVRQDRSSASDINDAVDILRSAKSRFLGCILNDMTSSVTEGQSYGYGYGYGSYGYGYGSYGYGNKKS